MKSNRWRTLTLIWGAVMIAVVSSTLTLLLAGRPGAFASGGMRWVSQDEYERIRRYEKLDEVRDTLMTQFYKPLEEDALVLGAIRGMTGAADDLYTFYYTPEELQSYNESSEGLYHGIGVLITMTEEGYIEILRVYPGTPAEDAGLRAGDLITAVDGVPIEGSDGKAYDEAVEHIRGEDGTQVELTLERDGQTFTQSVYRADVTVSYINYQMLDNGIGYVAITQFTGDAQKRFAEAIDFFRANGAKGMIIDVRNNPGGLLDQVVAIADSILPEGLIVYMQDRSGARADFYSDDKYYDVPLAVLTNGNSASASEILAASVQAFDRGKVVGLTTFGKGIVQTLITFGEDGSGMQLTTASYFDGAGRSIHGTGVTPDIEVALELDSVPLDPDPVSDNQLSAAIAALLGDAGEE